MLYSTEKAARYLSDPDAPLSRRTLEGWRLRGCGPRFVKIGSRVFYQQEDLDEYLGSRVFQSTAEAVA